MIGASETLGFGKRVYAEFSEKNVTFMAAAIAYNAFLSLAPMLLLLLLVISALGGGLEARIAAVASRWLPGPIGNVVQEIFRGSSSVASVSAVGLVVLLWGSLKIFRGLDVAFSEIYETHATNTFVNQLTDGIVVLVTVTVAIVATVGFSAAIKRSADSIPFISYLTPVVLTFGLILSFYPMYYRFPDTDVEMRDVLPGVVFAAVGWATLQELFQLYLAVRSPGSGSFFGSVIVIVTYLYFSGLVLLLGAVINAVAGDHSSGASGAVGRDTEKYDTERTTSLNRDELATYLQNLGEEVGGPHKGVGSPHKGVFSASDTASENERPRPDGTIEVAERSTVDGDTDQWVVTLRWDVAEESNTQAIPADD